MLYELKVCLRYLKPRKSSAYISINTIISMLGIAIGVTALIVVMGVMTGFGEGLKEKFVGLFSHLQISSSRALPISYYAEIQEEIENTPKVKAVSPFVNGHLTLRVGNLALPLKFWGVHPLYERNVSLIEEKYITSGNFDLKDEEGDYLALVVGHGIAERNGLQVGDRLSFGSTIPTVTGPRSGWFPAKVTGIFKSGIVVQDFELVYVSLITGQSLRGLNQDELSDAGIPDRGGQVAGFQARLERVEDSDEVKKLLQKKLGPGFEINSAKDLNRSLYMAIEQEKIIMYIILTLIVAVGALNIISSLTMTVMHRKREIGVLKSMGATRLSVMLIFALEGIVIGGVGIIFGIVGGLLIAYNVNPIADWVADITGSERLFSGEIFYLDKIPVHIDNEQIAIIALIALGLCILASVYPAFRAARLNPVEVLRYE
jgi:lipoprotein-releasing system permease protein